MSSETKLQQQQRSVIPIKVTDVMSYNLVTVKEGESALLAARRLVKRKVGSVLVINKEEQVVGIITKGDILREVLAKGLELKKVRASKVMTEPIVTIDYRATVEQASRLMLQKKVSKLPVLKDNNLFGIITATDVIRAEPIQVESLQELIRARFVPRDLVY